MSKKRVKKRQLNNRLLYSLIALGILVLAAVGVYAANTLLVPGTAPSVGHSINQLSPPSGCAAGQVLQWNGSANANGGWSCTLSVPTCSNGQTLNFSNGQWSCITSSSGVVSGGIYGYCTTGSSSPCDGEWPDTIPPAICNPNHGGPWPYCDCPSGYTQVITGDWAGGAYRAYGCLKN